MTGSEPEDSRLRSLVQQAERASAAGQLAESERLLVQAAAISPDHPLVLNAAGINALHRREPESARGLLQRATEGDGKNPAFWINLATAFHQLHRPQEELDALDRALKLEPRHLLALLQKGSALRDQGKHKASAKVYRNALQTIPRGAQVAPTVRPALERALKYVREDEAALDAFLRTQLHKPRERHAGELQDRFDHCVEGFLGKRAIYTPQPTFLYFPKLPAWEFYRREDFPWLDAVEAATAEIRMEFERVLAEDGNRLEPYVAYPEGVPLDQWAELNHSRRWSVFYLWRDGKPQAEHLARCPRTAEVLAKVPAVDVPGYAPTAFFSILDAKSHIPAHTGVTNTRLIVHVPLVIPPGCRFRVGSETREWRAGEALVFDDTIEHEAWNDSDVPRGVLIFDIWNPYLTPAECDLVRVAVQSVREYYRDESPPSGSG